jgi:GNAT superfamily N-acetyltransferase
MTTDHELRYAAPADVPRLAALMGSALMRDPVSRWLFPNDTDRAVRHPAFFQVFLDQAVTRGTVHRTADYTAVALWLMVGPGGPPPPTRTAEASLTEACGPNYDRFRTLDHLMQLHHLASQRHAYLPFIAVAPEHWGHGIGTVLLRHRLAQLDLAAPLTGGRRVVGGHRGKCEPNQWHRNKSPRAEEECSGCARRDGYGYSWPTTIGDRPARPKVHNARPLVRIQQRQSLPARRSTAFRHGPSRSLRRQRPDPGVFEQVDGDAHGSTSG